MFIIVFVVVAALLFFGKDMVSFNGCVGCIGWLIIVFIVASIIGIIFSGVPH